MTGAIAPDHRPVLPSTHVSVPAYWTAMASYLNGSAPPGNLLVLPEDDFYQMPYTWGYYGADALHHGPDSAKRGGPGCPRLHARLAGARQAPSASSSRGCSPTTGHLCNRRSRLSERRCCWSAET